MSEKLKDYLMRVGESYSAFARQIEVTPQAVSLWANGDRTPRSKQLKRIMEATKGKVTPNDFYASSEAGDA